MTSRNVFQFAVYKILKTREKNCFILGVAVYLSVSLFCVIYPNIVRNVPVEVDDSYAYIFKAVQMEQCFFQDCSATRDILSQIENVSEENKNAVNARIKEPLFLIYHPLHSLCVLLIYKIGFGWEKSLLITNIFGAFILFSGVCLWLKSISNSFVAAMGLLFLSLSTFPDQGLHYIVPSNISLGIALIVWSCIIDEKKHPGAIVVIGSLCMVGMHRIGIIYASISLALYIIFQIKNKKRVLDFSFVIVILIIIAVFFIPGFIENPFMSTNVTPLNISFIDGIKLNLVSSTEKIKHWSFVVGFPVITIILSIFALALVKNFKFHLAVLLGFVCMVIGEVYYVPGYPGELFSRTSIVFGIVYSAILGYVLQFCLGVLVNTKFVESDFNISSSLLLDSKTKYIYWIISISLVIILLFSVKKSFFAGSNQIVSELGNMIVRHNLLLDFRQTKYINDEYKNGKILFSVGDTIPMSYFLINGAIHREILYLELLKANNYNSQEINTIVNLYDPNFGVSYNPIHLFVIKQIPKTIIGKLIKQRQGILISKNEDFIVVNSEDYMSLNDLNITIENQSASTSEFVLEWQVNHKEKSIKYLIESGIHNYNKIVGLQGEMIDKIRIKQTQGELPLSVKGVKIGSEVKTSWGWDQGLKIEKYHKNDVVQTVSLSSNLLFPGVNKKVIVEMDCGSTIVSRFIE